MKKLLLISFILLLGSKGYSQSEPLPIQSYWGVAVGLRFQKVQDQLVSQVRFSGAPVYFMIDHEKIKFNGIRNFQFEGSVGPIKTKEFELGEFPARYLQPKITSYWNEITYSHLFLWKSDEVSKWYVGPSASNLIHVRYSPRWDNSGINYDISGNIQAEIRYKRDFPLFGKAMVANIGLKLPLVGYMTRPIYAGSPDFLDQEKSFEKSIFENTSVSWIGNFPRIQFDNFVEFPIAGGNKIQVLYNWEYYSFQEPNLVQTAAHTIGINFLMNTK